ncbi:heavy-metal-associated domain-containing protein [Streptomyces sp. ISL-36]|uniref:cation transporter n=1 Tax=Streptomyces sp. ISL-36 TaxID=2819182 RepID=UPI001BEB36C3|nr:cation transporter [Streptomyces sp. ISL-36]MBT2444347.1 heavy-metal-associated domain-containing protein [Streptomyces sp. ISL-36]
MSAYSTTYKVAGVNSGHCKAIVSGALRELDAVDTVHVEISTGLVTVNTAAEPDDKLIEETIEDAGYDYIGRA